MTSLCKTTFQEGYYLTTTVEKKYEQHSYMLPRWHDVVSTYTTCTVISILLGDFSNKPEIPLYKKGMISISLL